MKRQSFRRLFSLLSPYKFPYMASLIGLAIVMTSERLYVAYIIKLFVDSITSTNLQMLWHTMRNWFLFMLGFIPIGLFFFYWWRSTIYRVVANLRQTVFSHLQRLPLGYLEQRHSGDLISVMTNDISSTEQAYQEDLLNLVNATMQGVSAAIFMFFLEWRLALIVIFSGLIPLVINAVFANPLRKAGEQVQARLGNLSEYMAELLTGYTIVRTFSLGEWILGRFDKSNRELLGAGMQRVRLEAALAGGNALGGMSIFLPFGIGSYMVITGQTTFGILVALIQLNNQIQFFVYSLGGTITRLQGALAGMDRVLNVIDTEPEPERYGSIGIEKAGVPTQDNSLEFQNVRFGYDGASEVLSSLSFGVKQGQVAAFVGPSGSGKSTIFKLLLGCYPVKYGTIFVNGKSINRQNLSELRETFAYIPQDAYLYSGTILDNIRYGKPEASIEQVKSAAQSAYAHDFIMDFPDDYQTIVGERGARLSGGQRQRIAIARALLKDAPVLLLDEATSALDSESEELVQRALEVLMQGRTVLVIAHRLSTIENADIIYTVDQGKVVEAGSHQELLAQNGLYAHLHSLQFKDDSLYLTNP